MCVHGFLWTRSRDRDVKKIPFATPPLKAATYIHDRSRLSLLQLLLLLLLLLPLSKPISGDGHKICLFVFAVLLDKLGEEKKRNTKQA